MKNLSGVGVDRSCATKNAISLRRPRSKVLLLQADLLLAALFFTAFGFAFSGFALFGIAVLGLFVCRTCKC